MIAGLPWTSWILMLSAFGIGLIIVFYSYFSNHLPKNSNNTHQNKQDR